MDALDIIVKEHCEKLRNGGKTIGEIYKLVFSDRDAVMSEVSSVSLARCARITYGEAAERINKLAVSISRIAGSDGNFIALRAENSPEWIILFWAILKSGNKPYLVNLRQPDDFINSILRTLNVNLLIYIGKKPCLDTEEVDFALLEENAVDFECDLQAEFGNEIALTTSGTTLKHKICIYSGREITEMLLNTEPIVSQNREIKASYNGRLKQFAFLPFYHIFGLEATYLWFSLGHITFVFPKNMSPETLLRTIKDHEVTHIFAVPLFWHTVEKSILREIELRDEKTRAKFEKGIELSLKLQRISPKLGLLAAKKMFKEVRENLFGDSIKFCITGGSYIKESTLRLMNAIGYPLYNGYGMSEIGITSVELSERVDDRLKNSIGKPFSSVEYAINDDGHLTVCGESVCRKIIVDGEECQWDGWFDTGDIMTVDDTGRYYIEGRASDIVFSDDGEKLNPDLAEKAFVLKNAKNVVVMGDERNENLMLVVQLPKNSSLIQKQEILTEIKEKNLTLPLSYQIKKIRFTYDAIMNENDIKVSRMYLRQMLNEGKVCLFDNIDERFEEDTGNDSEIKQILRELFAKVLGRDASEITSSGHFMNDLGGTSLDYFTLISEIDKAFDITVDYEDGDFGYSLDDFTKLVERKSSEK